MAKAQTAVSYEAKDIVVYEGLESVRAKPGMYLGGKDSDAVTHSAFEIIDNSVDEAMNGHGDWIQIHFAKSGFVTVKDEGRGIPVGPHPKIKGEDTLTIVVGRLHAGGKMNNAVYKTSGGVHGVGAAVTNAVSESFEVWSWRNKQWNYQSFAKGKPTSKVIKKDPPKVTGMTMKNQGTIVRFKPDATVFDKDAKMLPKRVQERMDVLTQLLPVKVTIIDEIKGKTKTLHKPDGMAGMFKKIVKDNDLTPMQEEPFVYSDENIDVMVGWAQTSGTYISSYVSFISTSDGGTHVEGLKEAIYLGCNDLANTKDVYSKDSLTKGLIAVINVKMSGATFTSQDKVKLATKEVRQATINHLYWNPEKDENGPLYAWMLKNKKVIRAVLDYANEYTSLHEEFKASTELSRELATEKKGKSLLPIKLLQSATRKPEERELFLIEGDSAKGSVAKARNSQYQEVFPLRGKIPNIWKLGPEKTMANEVVKDMCRAIGYKPKDPKKADDGKPMEWRVGKVMILTDADDDGSHISALLLGFFWKVMPQLVIEGRLFMVQAPLYVYEEDAKNIHFASTLPELMELGIKNLNKNKINRLKGWGETTSPVMTKAAFDHDTRSLVQVEPLSQEDEEELEKQLDKLIGMLGEDTTARKELIGV